MRLFYIGLMLIDLLKRVKRWFFYISLCSWYFLKFYWNDLIYIVFIETYDGFWRHQKIDKFTIF